MKTIPLLFALAMAGAAVVLGRAETVPAAPAPTWALKDVNGKVVTSTEFKGKVVVLDFWATWCGPCRKEIPGYMKLQEKYRKDGLVIIGVSLDRQGPKVVREFIVDHHVNYQMVMGDDEVVSAFGGIEAIPTTFIIDRDGNIRDKKIGGEETSEYEQRILQYLK